MRIANFCLIVLAGWYGLSGAAAELIPACHDHLEFSGAKTRERLIDDLVVRHKLLFTDETAFEFERAFKRILSATSTELKIDFSFAKAGQALSVLTSAQRLEIAEHIWKNLLQQNNFNLPPTSETYLKIADQRALPIRSARALHERMAIYENSPELRSEIIKLIDTRLPQFLRHGALFVATFAKPQLDSSTYYGLGFFKKRYKDVRWRMPATLAVLSLATVSPLILDVFWSPAWASIDENVLVGATSATSFVVTATLLGNLRRVVRTFWRRHFVRGILNSAPSLKNLPREVELDLLDGVKRAPSETRRQLGAIEISGLDPGAPEYLAREFAEFGEAELTERTLLISTGLAGVRDALDRGQSIRETAAAIRESIARPEFSIAPQSRFTLDVHRQLTARKILLQNVLDELRALDRALTENIEFITRFLNFARDFRAPSAQAERNLRGHIVAFGEQADVTTLLRTVLDRMEREADTEHAFLRRAITSLALINVETPSGGKASDKWQELAKLLNFGP